ncbi:hypothetical protein D3C76_1427470 [compost metagenome]
MGFIENLRKLVKGNDSDNKKVTEDTYAKSMIAREVVNLVEQINKINSFDSSIRTLINVSSHQLQSKSMADLQNLRDTLSYKLSTIDQQRKVGSTAREALEESKWTGKKPNTMTDRQFDRHQRDESR